MQTTEISTKLSLLDNPFLHHHTATCQGNSRRINQMYTEYYHGQWHGAIMDYWELQGDMKDFNHMSAIKNTNIDRHMQGGKLERLWLAEQWR